mmetsp:Transcript_16272/g.31544  ORF Transcript_16272/g.31544 Transcript_16272/m.31544 type:complete len:94 (+) Transcript_16272:1948-2229(+)
MASLLVPTVAAVVAARVALAVAAATAPLVPWAVVATAALGKFLAGHAICNHCTRRLSIFLKAVFFLDQNSRDLFEGVHSSIQFIIFRSAGEVV